MILSVRELCESCKHEFVGSEEKPCVLCPILYEAVMWEPKEVE